MSSRNRELKIAMREALLSVYKEVVSGGVADQRTAYMLTVRHKSPRYWLDWQHVYYMMLHLMRGERCALEGLRGVTRRKYEALEREVMDMLGDAEWQGKSLRQVCQAAVLREAPEFFITWGAFKWIHRNIKRYGIDYEHNDVVEANRRYTNMKDGKPSDARFDYRRSAR